MPNLKNSIRLNNYLLLVKKYVYLMSCRSKILQIDLRNPIERTECFQTNIFRTHAIILVYNF